MDTVVLAYSGGLDTSVAIRWIKEHYNLDVIALSVDVGNNRDLDAIQAKALKIGAIKSLVVDGKELFVNYFVWPALQAGAIYQGQYLLATALARPLIAKLLVDVAIEEGATAVAHGCTGKGNDQVRFDVSVQALAPHLKVIAPVREWGMTRDEALRYAAKHDIPVPATVANPYSVDLNLWGRSVEAGVREDPWQEPPEEVYEWTSHPADWPREPGYVEIEFDHGIPVALYGERMEGVALIEQMNELAGKHGVGRIDHIEDRLVGIKSREVYEAPAGQALFEAHRGLESVTLSRDTLRFKKLVADEYSQLIYNGLFFSALRSDLQAFVTSTQRYVSGTVRLRLHQGTAVCVGRKSPLSLYNEGLATYSDADTFDHTAAVGFIKLFGQQTRTDAQVHHLGAGSDDEPLLRLAPPKVLEADR